MKWSSLLLALLTLPLLFNSVPLEVLRLKTFDALVPEQPAIYIPPEKEFFLHLGDYNEPPTKGQMIFFWTLNALDVYTTYEGLKKPNVYEKMTLWIRSRTLNLKCWHRVSPETSKRP